jgi:hypothetical protein
MKLSVREEKWKTGKRGTQMMRDKDALDYYCMSFPFFPFPFFPSYTEGFVSLG